MSNFIKSSILGLLIVICLPAHATCDGLDFPFSSANSSSVEQIGEVISIKSNNQVIVGGKAKRNAFFNQTVEAAQFPDRLVKVRKFKVQGDKDIKINFTVQTLTSQYHFSDSTLPSRTFAIAELDDDGTVNCAGFIESVTATAGTTTIKKGTQIFEDVNFTGSLADPIQVFIQEKGPDVTIVFQDVILEAGKTYQFEFISQGEKSAQNNSVTDEQYQLRFGKTAKIDIDNDTNETVVDDDVPLANYFAEDSSFALINIFGSGQTEVGITSPAGAAAREFQDFDDEIPADDYDFKLAPEKIGKDFAYTFIDGTGTIFARRSSKPLINFIKNNTGSKTKGKVTVNEDRSQTKQAISYTSTRTADKFLAKKDARAKIIIKVNINDIDETDLIDSGFTNVTFLNFEENNFLGQDIVIEVPDPDADLALRNMFVTAIINDVDNTPNGSYDFSVNSDSFDAVVIRKGKTLNLEITDNPINIAVIDSSVFVTNGVVPDEERGQLTIEVNDNGKELLRGLEEGDEVFITFDITSEALLFEDDYGVVILRKTGD